MKGLLQPLLPNLTNSNSQDPFGAQNLFCCNPQARVRMQHGINNIPTVLLRYELLDIMFMLSVWNLARSDL
jgi:hypothetical protein